MSLKASPSLLVSNVGLQCRDCCLSQSGGGAKSFVDDLVSSQGVVLSRGDVLLRSFETKPRDSQICSLPTIAGQVATRPVLLPENGRLRLFWGFSVCQLAKQPANLRPARWRLSLALARSRHR